MSVNKVILIGNLGRDPEIRYSQSGAAVGNLNIATTHRVKDQSGQWSEQTEWHRVVVLGRTAEVAGEYLRKGRPVYIEGRIQTRKWQDQSGQDRYTTEVLCENMQMLGGRGDGAVTNEGTSGAPSHASQQGWPQPSQQPRRDYQANNQQPQGGMADMDDDIPFNAYFVRNAYAV